ncbi:heavy metal-associated isoprenylated plant protein 3 [Sorghum bicolor]|uniref:HMA domain-containing protein n=1 Tax=Sorghum bicolor TaxID=4558 RepID=C5WRV7_SORBI|nr:heavy metal-associated isoprenylated plant protein 3 [Sorghum bicolor]EER93056.1 hypothetical protein SORBI_3001G003400 [Sorghum bicolor]OQU90587.1 hypothetical protein SORBI_3001G003400 [Sorghum bicolor]|eukprot:XP_002466058.1 heavy metal-associated isoprenylated plant protein 3 [Sorghum bicolor]
MLVGRKENEDEETEDERRTAEAATTKTKTKKKKGDGDEAAALAVVYVVVLRMELHCDGCALKVRKAIKGAHGAESVRTDVAAGTVTVAGNGKADPWDLRDRIQARMPAVDIAFVSPANPPPPPPKDKDADAATAKKNNKGKGRHDKQTMPPPPPESTVVLNIQLHCKGCIDRIKRKANKIKGVKQVSVDTIKEQVTVKGTMDAKALPDVLSAKLKRRVTAVVVTNKNKDKKAAAGPGDNHDDNREQGEEEEAGGTNTTAGGANKKKNKNCKKQQQRGNAAAVPGDDHDDEMASFWMSEEQQYPMTIFPASYGRGGSVGPSYRVELLQGPQPFSDDNPNACSLM